MVDFFDWSKFLVPHFQRIKGIKDYHHFTVKSARPGVVELKVYRDSEEETVELLKDWEPSTDLPDVIPPPGLSAERQWYLYDHIRHIKYTRYCLSIANCA